MSDKTLEQRRYKERDLSGTRYALLAEDPTQVEDTKYKEFHQLFATDEQDELFERFVAQLIVVVNGRVGRYDPLLNSQDAFDAVLLYLTTKSPALLQSGLMQPLIDLWAAVHDRVVGGRPELFYNRSKEMNGSFRRLESHLAQEEHYRKDPEAHAAAIRSGLLPSSSEGSDRPLRPSSDVIQGVILIAFQAITNAYNSNSDNAATKRGKVDTLMERLLKELRIRNTDNKRFHDPSNTEDQQLLSSSTVRKWVKTVNYKDRANYGRNYCYKALSEKYGSELKSCKGKPEHAYEFAKYILDRVRHWQPAHFPPVGIR